MTSFNLFCSLPRSSWPRRRRTWRATTRCGCYRSWPCSSPSSFSWSSLLLSSSSSWEDDADLVSVFVDVVVVVFVVVVVVVVIVVIAAVAVVHDIDVFVVHVVDDDEFVIQYDLRADWVPSVDLRQIRGHQFQTAIFCWLIFSFLIKVLFPIRPRS